MKKVTKTALLIFTIAVMMLTLSASVFAKEAKNAATLEIKNVQSGINLKWNALENVSSYKVYRKGEKDKKRTLIKKTKKTVFTDEKAKDGKKYGYSVVPVYKSSETGKRSNEEFLMRLGTPKIKKYTNTENGIKLSWSVSEGATSYRIYRRDESAKKWQRIGKTNASTLSFTDKNVSAKKNYTYMVKGCNSGSSSYRSNCKKADFLKTPEINKISSNKKSLRISWTKSPKAVSYEIYRITAGQKDFELYKTVKSGTLKFTDKNVEVGKKYGYTVRAVDKNKKVSGHKTATYCVLMKMPKITKSANTTNGIKLTWTKTPSAQGYNLYRCDADGTAWKKVLTTNSLSATDKTAANGKSYVYTVRALYNGVQSTYSKEGFSARFLSAPSNVSVELVSKDGNKISWSPNRSATDYNIYRKPEKGNEWTRIGRTSKTSFTDKTAKDDRLYSYFVRAYIKTDCKSATSKTVISTNIDPKGKMIALTYDDGPSNLITNRVLDFLEKYGAKATFFVVGSRIDAHHEPLQRAVKLGCEIGNHTFGHVDLPSYEKEEIIAEISKTNNLVKKYTGVTPKLARAPGGSTDPNSRKAVGMPFIYWSIDTRDWETRNPALIIAHVKNEACDGSIILMHDIYEATAEATQTIVPWLINEGYQLVTVSELMRYRGIKLQKGVTYYNGYR